MMGIEPTNGGTTNRCLNLLATPAVTINHYSIRKLNLSNLSTFFLMNSAENEKVNGRFTPLTIGGIIFLILGTVLMLTNPSRKEYEKFATEELVLYLKENVCQQKSQNLEEAIKSQMCNLMVDTGKNQVPKLVDKTTLRHNYLLLSVYETDLYVYNFQTIGVFNSFYVIAANKSYDQQ